MTNYIVVDDTTGDFIAIDSIVAIVENENGEGSKIVIGADGTSIRSPLKPRELLRRLTIIKYKQETGTKPVLRSTL
jgi:hypothetical protein